MGPTHIDHRLAFSVKSLAGHRHIGKPLKKGHDTLLAYLSDNGIPPVPITGNIVPADGVQQTLQSPLTHQRFDSVFSIEDW